MGLFNFKNNNTKAPKVKPNKIVDGKDIYVLDTNIPLLNPKFYDLYDKGTIFVIPFMVVTELNTKKTSPDRMLARNAREFNRVISDISDKKFASGEKYIEHNGYYFRIKNTTIVGNPFINKKSSTVLRDKTNDDYIVATALTIKALEPKSKVIMMSNDVDVRVRSNELMVKAIRFDQEDIQNTDIYDAIPEVSASDELIAELYSSGIREIDGLDLVENSGVILVTKDGKRIPTRVKDGALTNLKCYIGQAIKGLKALNSEQEIMLDMMLDEDVRVMGVIGRSGTGKTLLAIATALMLQDDRKYGKVRLIKDLSAMGGQDVGYLPGGIEDKLAGFRLSYNDSFEFIGDLNGVATTKGDHFGGGKKQSYLDTLIDHSYVEFSSPSFMRGRSIGVGKIGDFIILDEMQNVTPMLLKSILTRFGEKSKIIALGDVRQLDNRFLTEKSCGLAVMCDNLLGKSFFGHLTLSKSQRSKFIDEIDEAF